MDRAVAITGMGIISAVGNDVAENRTSLIGCKTGIAHIRKLNTRHKGVLPVGEVALTNTELIDGLGLSSDDNHTRTALLGIWAAKEAVEQAGIKDINSVKTGLISATSVGGMDMTEQYYHRYTDDPSVQKYIKSHHAGDSSQKIAEYLGLREGLVTTVSTACSSATNAIMLGARLVKAGKLDRAIVGGADCLSKFTINGFHSLMILSDENNRPFDADRKGLNLGEAAAYLVLESDEITRKEDREVLAYISGYGNANDAFHQTASSENGEGATLAMQKALQTAGLSPWDIDYVNAHGTATPNNDLSESRALRRVFGDKVPPFSSTKAYTGHTLAAAGAVEAVYSVLSLQHGEIYPTFNFKKPIPETGLSPIAGLTSKPTRTVMSNSFGFGGNCSSVIFKSI